MTDPAATRRTPTGGRAPAAWALRRFVLLYMPFALAWILASTMLVARISGDAAEAFAYLMIAAVAFVGVTAMLLYLVTRRALDELTQHDSLLRAVVEGVPDLIVRASLVPELRFEYVSQAATGIAGYEAQEIYDDPELFLRAVHPDDAAALRRLLEEPSPEQRSVDLRFLHKDDRSTVWTETRVSWETDPQGRPTAAVAVVRNVTARHEAQRTAELLATAVEAAGEAVVVTDAEGTIQYVNARFAKMSGYRPDEIVGQNPRILKSGRQNPRFYARLWSTLRSGGTFQGHFVNRAKDGRLYEQQSTITPVGPPDGPPTHFVAVARDVTVEREIRRQISATERAAAVAQLAAGIAHDFRNLLAVVTANVTHLASLQKEGSEASQALHDIERAASGGSELVSRLLDIARPASGKESLAHLPDLVDELTGLLKAAIDRSVSVVLSLDQEVPPVRVDRAQIEQALLNLVRNAAQAMPGGGTLTLSVGQATALPPTADPNANPGGFVRVAVTDTGVGMDAEVLSRVGVPFFTTKETGTGLGAAMVAQTVEAHAGYVHYQSEPGVGTTVSIYLPVAEEMELVEAAEASPRQKDLPGGSERILIVEDDPGLRRATERALARLGYETTTAEGGLAAIEMIEEGHRWDLILTDLIMPGLGGAELYQRLRERDIQMPVVFVSGHAPDFVDQVTRGLPTGFLQKPWTVESLTKTVRSVLDAT